MYGSRIIIGNRLRVNKAISPFIPPTNSDNFDVKHTKEPWKDEDLEIMKKQTEMVKQPNIQALFEGYYYM